MQVETQGFAMLLLRGVLAYADARWHSRPWSRRSSPKSAEESQESPLGEVIDQAKSRLYMAVATK
jgi:hypothetical protein